MQLNSHQNYQIRRHAPVWQNFYDCMQFLNDHISQSFNFLFDKSLPIVLMGTLVYVQCSCVNCLFLSVWLEYNTFSIIIMFVKYLLCTKLNIAEVVYMLKAMALHNHLCCQIIDNFAIFDSSSSFCMKKNKYLFLSLIYNLRRVILEINLICSNS